jgi:hypothetical protein
MNFITYIILGIAWVFLAGTMFQKIMHTNFIKYTGSNEFILFLTRDISGEGRQHGPRVFTVWNLSHIVYFALGAYFYPDKALLLWTLGLVWELLEDYINVMNPLDILWNTIGILIGLALRNVRL